MQDFGEAFTPRRAYKAHQSHDLTSAARRAAPLKGGEFQ